MDTRRSQANGIAPSDKPRGRSIFDVMPSEEEKVTSPLLSTDESSKIKEKNALNERKSNSIDLNKVNSLKTDSKPSDDKADTELAVYYKPEKEESYKEAEKKKKDGEGEEPTPAPEGVKFIGLGDDDSICSTEPEQEAGPQIPDGGWGWVVVASAFLISTVADGLAFSFGLLHMQFIRYFEETESKTSLIGSLFISVPLIAGPVMSALVDRYGCRKMTIVGGIASTIGFLLASISDSIETMCFTYGFLSGLGMGLLYVTAVVSIAYWFEKKRNLAVSLGACGIGFGTVIFAPMTEYFLENYTWRQTIVLLSGSLLNMCICGAVMKDPEWWTLEQKKQAAINKSKRASSSASISARSARSGGNESVFPGVEEIKSLMKSGESPEYILTRLVTSIAVAENLDLATKKNAETLAQQKVNSVINLPTYLKQSEKVPAEVLELLQSNKQLYNIVLENYPSLLALRSNSETKLPIEPEVPKKKPVTMSMKLKINKKDKKEPATKLDTGTASLLPPIPEKKAVILKGDKAQGHRQAWLSRQLSVNHHYLRDIRVHRNSMMHRGAMMNISKYKLRASSCPNIYKNSMWSIAEQEEERKWYTSFVEVCRDNFDFQLFTEFHFLMMNLSTILLFVWFIVPYFYLPSLLIQVGHDSSWGSQMLSIIGAASTVGIVVLGWAGDQPWINVTKTYAVCLMICGVSTGLYPLISHSYWLLAVNSAVFGMSFASSYSYTPTILVELTTLERFTKAYGLILLSQGVGHLVGPPIAGGLFDVTGQWNLSFYMAGLWVVVSGLFIGVIPYTNNMRLFGSKPLSKDEDRASNFDNTNSNA